MMKLAFEAAATPIVNGGPVGGMKVGTLVSNEYPVLVWTSNRFAPAVQRARAASRIVVEEGAGVGGPYRTFVLTVRAPAPGDHRTSG